MHDDTHRMVTIACDADRTPNVTRELLTLEDCIRAHAQKVAKEKTAQ